MRGDEDRAYREVDRAREEGKDSAIQLKEVGRHVEQLQRRLESKQDELTRAQQDAVAQRARADTLETQLQLAFQPAKAKSRPSKKASSGRAKAHNVAGSSPPSRQGGK